MQPLQGYITWYEENKHEPRLYIDPQHQERLRLYYADLEQAPIQSAVIPRYTDLHQFDTQFAGLSQIEYIDLTAFETTYDCQKGLKAKRSEVTLCINKAQFLHCGARKAQDHVCSLYNKCMQDSIHPCFERVYPPCLAVGPNGHHYCAHFAPFDRFHAWNDIDDFCTRCETRHCLWVSCFKALKAQPLKFKVWTLTNITKPIIFINEPQRTFLKESNSANTPLLKNQVSNDVPISPELNVPALPLYSDDYEQPVSNIYAEIQDPIESESKATENNPVPSVGVTCIHETFNSNNSKCKSRFSCRTRCALGLCDLYKTMHHSECPKTKVKQHRWHENPSLTTEEGSKKEFE